MINEELKLVFDLQLFASAEDEGRTEQPTEKRLREAREKGQVAKTQEMAQALVVIFGILLVFALGPWMFETLSIMMKRFLTSFSSYYVTEKSIITDFHIVLFHSAKIVLPVFAIAVVAAVIGNIIQVGFLVSAHPLKMDFKKIKLSFPSMMKKVFFSKQVAMNLFKSLFKVISIAFIAYLIIMSDIDDIMKTPDMAVAKSLKLMMMSGFKIIVISAVFLLILSIPDYYFQKREFLESLKMTKQQLRQEYKESEGDPRLRARLREMHRNLIKRNMIREIPKADVIITNPTHYSIALKFERETMPAPMLTAKGIDSIALKIREIARENNVRIIENRPLAQRLYKDVEIGDIIPEELYHAVIMIYSELYKAGDIRQTA